VVFVVLMEKLLCVRLRGASARFCLLMERF